MKNVSKTLASVADAFTMALTEAKYQTTTGKDLIQKYQSYVMSNEITCNLVNNFLQEARTMTYDNGVVEALKQVSSIIEGSKYLWLLESACERIESDPRAYTYLNKNAVKMVKPLLEMNEDDVVTYIKAGALKDVMYVESFRNIANSIFKATPVVETTEKYTCVHPVSIIEQNEDSVYFVANRTLYKMTQDDVKEALWNEVSNDFKVINQLLESNLVTYTNENGGSLKFKTQNFELSISEEGKCKKTVGDKVYEYTTDQLREQNALYLNGLAPKSRATLAPVLEAMAKCCENFNNIAVLDNVGIYTTSKDQFMVIESKEDNSIAKLLKSSHTSEPWSVTNNIYEVVNYIKKRTNTDLFEAYKTSIDEAVAEEEEKDQNQIKESLKNEAIQQRKEKIEELTKQFKNDPVKLAMLAKIAEDLNNL